MNFSDDPKFSHGSGTAREVRTPDERFQTPDKTNRAAIGRMIVCMRPTCVYRDFYLSAMSSETGDGGFQARVAVVTLSQERTRSQRFVDSEVCLTEAEANAKAIESGKQWVDAHLLGESRLAPTDFAPLASL